MNEVEKLTKHVRRNGYKHLVFDLDETITRLHLPWPEGYELLYDRAPNHIEKQMREDFARGEAYGVVLNKAVEQHDEFLPLLLAWAHEFEAQLVSHEPHDELVAALPQFAAEGRRLVLWTSNTRRAALQTLTELNIAQHFDVIVARDDVRLIKPNAEGWRHIYGSELLGEYLFIGDSENDCGAAEAVGIDFFEIKHFK